MSLKVCCFIQGNSIHLFLKYVSRTDIEQHYIVAMPAVLFQVSLVSFWGFYILRL